MMTCVLNLEMTKKIITKKKLKSGKCPKHFHVDKARKDSDTMCVQDCTYRSPPMVRNHKKGKEGKCLRPKSDWLKGLLEYYKTNRARRGADFSYGSAMKEFKLIYQKSKAQGR